MLTALVLSLATTAPQDLLSRPNPAEPTPVSVGILVNDVILVEEPTHSFMADVVVHLSWHDERLADPSATGNRRLPRRTVWSPRFTVLNERRVQTKFDDEVIALPNGDVRYMQRYVGAFNTSFDLRDFPMDSQALHFDLVFLGAAEDPLDVTVDGTFTRVSGAFSIVDWRVDEGRATVETFTPVPGRELPLYRHEIRIERRVGYYVWKILLPLVLITGMAATVFWIDPKNSGPQISVSVSSILTLIAYRFLLGGQVPRLSYLTRLDHFILGATVMVFGALVVVITTSALAGQDRYELARRIDGTARVVYPLLLAGLVVACFGI